MNVNCGCGRKAGIKICENDQNKNRLYYYCMSGKCIGFLGWCQPTMIFPQSQSGALPQSQSGGASSPFLHQRNTLGHNNNTYALLHEIKDEILNVELENRRLFGKFKDLEGGLGYVKRLLIGCVMLLLIFSGFILVLLSRN